MKNQIFTPCPNKDCFDIKELIWEHVKTYYNKILTKDQIEEILWSMIEQDKINYGIYDTSEEFAENMGWEMTI